MSDPMVSRPLQPADQSYVPRRRVLGIILAAVPVLAAATAARAAVCLDMNSLPSSDKSLRASLNFKMHSTDAKKQCRACAFFETAGDNCGRCQLLSGGPVLVDSICDSWAAKG